jgi:hypothetical protein
MNEIVHDLRDVAVVFIVFASLPALIIVPLWFRSRERARMQDTVRAAIQQGQALPSDVIDAMTRGAKRMPSRRRDFRQAVIWLAIAAAFGTWGLLDQWNLGVQAPSNWFGFAVIPLFIGLAFLVLGFLNGKRD